MNQYSNQKLTPFAKNLRRNMTKEERHLWYDCLKALPVTVHRQKVIGQYIVDFCIPQAKMIIELDGTQHFEETGLVEDYQRDEYLKSLGFTVLRYANSQVNKEFSAVCQDIYNRLKLE